MQDTYLQQAHEFLKKTNTEMKIQRLGRQFAPWQDQKNDSPVNALLVTLKTDRHQYTFTFYTSLNDTYGPELNPRQYRSTFKLENAKKKHAAEIKKKDYTYDVLACLNVDYSEDFEDFCLNYGYETDSRKALDTYLAVREETGNLKKLWSTSELELLHEIS